MEGVITRRFNNNNKKNVIPLPLLYNDVFVMREQIERCSDSCLEKDDTFIVFV